MIKVQRPEDRIRISKRVLQCDGWSEHPYLLFDVRVGRGTDRRSVFPDNRCPVGPRGLNWGFDERNVLRDKLRNKEGHKVITKSGSDGPDWFIRHSQTDYS